MADPKAALKGIPTRDSLMEVLAYVDEGVQAGKWRFDHVVITGDMAHDEQLETYEALRELLGKWTSRCSLIPGNHDDRDCIRQAFPQLVPRRSPADGVFLNFSLAVANWRLIGLDSHVDGEVAGHLDGRQLKWLSDQLTLHKAQPTILFVHHPPFSVDSPWLDAIGLREPSKLIELIQSFPQVRAISSGHVHQEFADVQNGLRLLTTPSTAVQFKPREPEPVYHAVPPGFRVFQLEDDTFQTQVVRLAELKFPPQSTCAPVR